MPKVLVIEDEDAIAEPLVYQLQNAGFEAQWVGKGDEGVTLFRDQGADLIVLDLMLPGLPGEDVCKAIRADSDVPIIMLTARDSEVDRVVGLELGADDYVTKPFSTRELIARIKAVLRRGRSADDSTVLEGGGIRLDRDRFEVAVRGKQIHLPRKEFELLEMLMENRGRVITRESIIDRIWGSEYFGDTRTLDVHIKRLRSKTEADPHEPQHLLTVRGVGYKFVP